MAWKWAEEMALSLDSRSSFEVPSETVAKEVGIEVKEERVIAIFKG